MFEKLKENIYKTYLKENKIKNIEKSKLTCDELTKDINGIFYRCLKSYYFEDYFKDYELMKTNTPEGEYYFIAGFSHSRSKTNYIHYECKDQEEADALNNQKTRGIFSNITNKGMKVTLTTEEYKSLVTDKNIKYLNDIQDVLADNFSIYNEDRISFFPYDTPYDNKRNYVEVDNNERIEKTILKLKEKEEFKILFETDPIAKLLNLKSKKDFNYEIIHHDNNDYEKNDSSIQSLFSNCIFEDKHNINKTLINVYDLNYYPNSRDKEFKLIYAHNNKEICGASMLIDINTYDSEIEKNIGKSISFVEVCKPFYGNKIGIELVKKAIEYAEKENLILFRTTSSTLGQKYIKEKIDEIAKNSNVNLVSEPERFAVNKIIKASKNKQEALTKTKELLKFIRENYTEEDLGKHKSMTEILNYIEDKKKSKMKIR